MHLPLTVAICCASTFLRDYFFGAVGNFRLCIVRRMEHISGGIGTILVLVAYFLVSTGKITSGSIGFQGMNLVGAILLTIYGFMLFAWASVALNAVWGLIAMVALVRVLRNRSKRSGSLHGK